MTPFITTVLGAWISIAIGMAAKPVYDFIEHWIPFVESKIPPKMKPFMVVLLTAGISSLAGMLKIQLNVDISGWQPSDVNTLLSSLAAFTLHNATKINKNASLIADHIKAS